MITGETAERIVQRVNDRLIVLVLFIVDTNEKTVENYGVGGTRNC